MPPELYESLGEAISLWDIHGSLVDVGTTAAIPVMLLQLKVNDIVATSATIFL